MGEKAADSETLAGRLSFPSISRTSGIRTVQGKLTYPLDEILLLRLRRLRTIEPEQSCPCDKVHVMTDRVTTSLGLCVTSSAPIANPPRHPIFPP